VTKREFHNQEHTSDLVTAGRQYALYYTVGAAEGKRENTRSLDVEPSDVA